MPALTQVILQDRETTPVNHTFEPMSIESGSVGTLVEYTGVPVGQSTMSLSVKEATKNYNAELRIKVPVVQTQTINGIQSPVVVRTAYATLKLSYDKASSEQERANIVGMLESALASSLTLVNDVIVELKSVY